MTKLKIQLTVNGQSTVGEIEPRLQLAEFLREHLLLTGTHLGCEHGVCGACTVNLDGAPARSCITYAVACDGADVRTIEGFDDDAVMTQLRDAFSAEHALQCGYCTPGMLVTARDIVLRLPYADEARIRKELAGNLCRCTGYVGIVRAIQTVLAKRPEQQIVTHDERSRGDFTAVRARRRDALERDEAQQQRLAVVPDDRPRVSESDDGSASPGDEARWQVPKSNGEPNSIRPAHGQQAPKAKDERPSADRATTLHQSFTVDHPRDKVWAFFGRLDEVTQCLPGATVTGIPSEDRVDVTLRVKLGPIAPEFHGSAQVTRDAATWSGVIHGNARDSRSPSTTRGEIRYALHDENSGAATRVDVDVDYVLTGPLAQFGRSSLVQDIARRMTAEFARNFESRLGEGEGALSDRNARRRAPAELNAGGLVLSALWARLKALFHR